MKGTVFIFGTNDFLFLKNEVVVASASVVVADDVFGR